MYIISACLAGENCKYNGGNNYNESVCQFTKKHNCIMICPEMEGGLPAPRPPAEQIRSEDQCAVCASDQMREGDRTVRVVNKEGRDVTEEFYRGAKISLARAEERAHELGEPIEGAILRANSPTCGSGTIYDGTFSGVLTEGDGIFAGMLKEKGIHVETRTKD